MLNFSNDDLTARTLEAMAHESRMIAEEIAWLGSRVSDGTADIVALQSFDALTQQMQAQAMLLAHLARSHNDKDIAGIVSLIHDIPLPQMRRRLLLALNHEAPEANNDDAIFWRDA